MKYVALLLLGLFVFAGCASPTVFYKPGDLKLQEVARSQRRWTGVAVSPGGTIFVNYPRWSDDVTFSVGQLGTDRIARPFPDLAWNKWSADQDPATHFVCVQSVVADSHNRLWVLDAASPKLEGVVSGGAKLVCFDIASGKLIHNYRFSPSVVLPNSYLNDVRIDTKLNYAYITDSGAGGLIVLDLQNGKARRLLDNSPATHAEKIDVMINGSPWTFLGSKPQVHADGIALSKGGRWLYFHALTGRGLYRIDTQWLRDDRVTASQVADLVQRVGTDRPCDGMEIDQAGNLYLTDIEQSSITRVVRNENGTVRYDKLLSDSRLEWPDSFAWDSMGNLYVTTSRLGSAGEKGPFRLFKLVGAR